MNRKLHVDTLIFNSYVKILCFHMERTNEQTDGEINLEEPKVTQPNQD